MSPDAAPSFDPPCGPVIGWHDRGVVRATGIPYATAARFAPPRATRKWSKPRSATSWAPMSPQPPVPRLERLLGKGVGTLPIDESCLNLSITLPEGTAPDAGLPVMVFVHGGSYVAGSGDAPLHDPRRLVAEQGVVVVNVTYRLGVLGFLGGDGRPANLGLLDVRAAFEWVQRNIRAFGGDPERVTAFGESAGADAIAHLLATTDAARLFHRAIIQSAPLGIRNGRAEMTAAMFAVAEGITADSPIEDVIAAQPEIAAVGAGFGLTGAMPFGVQYGHDPLPAEDAVVAAWEATAPRIPVLIGNNANESRMFIDDLPKIGDLVKIPLLGSIVRAAIDRALTRKVYAAPVDEFARRWARAGGEAYRYVIDWHAPGNVYRSAHTIDLPLLLGDETTIEGSLLLEGATWEEIDLAGRGVRQAWADFARGELTDNGRIDRVIRWHQVG